MKPFAELTDQFQKRRLRWAAEAALERYDVDVARLSFVAWHTNTTWRVDAADGVRYALRVGSSWADSETDAASELMFSRHLAAAGVPIVGAHPNRDGKLVTTVAVDGVPEPRQCVLFDWLPGVPLAKRISAAAYRRLGEISAAMHDAAASFRAPPGFDPLTWDRVFYYPNEPVVWAEPKYRRWITARRRAVLEQVIDRAGVELARLHRGAPIPIHGDLHPDNVMSYRGVLTVFDAEDCMWGFPCQDVAITLFYERGRADYLELRAAFEAGYRDVRPWPVEFDGQPELLMAARTAMFVNYVLRTDDDPGPYVATATDRLARYLAEYPATP